MKENKDTKIRNLNAEELRSIEGGNFISRVRNLIRRIADMIENPGVPQL